MISLFQNRRQWIAPPSKMMGVISPSSTGGFTPPHSMAGFTLIETLVAISILLVVIIGPMTIAQKGIQNAYFARDQLTAVFLAQEAIEAVRELRDDAALRVYDDLVNELVEPDPGDSWLWYETLENDSLNDTAECLDETGCGFDPDNKMLRACHEFGSGGCQLRVTPDGVYTYDMAMDAVLSMYTRKVYIESVGTNAVKVRVEVMWNSSAFGGMSKEVEIETWLYDRYKHYEIE